MLQDMGAKAVALFAVVVLAFGANEAYAASNAITVQACASQYNWCAPSQGDGKANCDFCCMQNGYPGGGLCLSFDETADQGCLCN